MTSLQTIDLSQPRSAGRVFLSRASAEACLQEDSPPPPSSSSSGSSLLGRLRDVFAPSGSRRPPMPASPISSVSDGDDVLSWAAGRAVWTRGLEVVRTFSYDTVDISQGAFAWFDSREAPHLASGFQAALESFPMRPDDARSSPPPTRFDFSTAASSALPLDPLASVVTKRRAVCLFFNEHVEIFLSSGDRHTLHLPFGFGRAWPLGEGLLIERSRSATSGEASPRSPSKRPDPPRPSQGKSSVFGLLELFGELLEVTHGEELADQEIVYVTPATSPVGLILSREQRSSLLSLYSCQRELTSRVPPSSPCSPQHATYRESTSRPTPRQRASAVSSTRRRSSHGASESFAQTSIGPASSSSSSTATRAAYLPLPSPSNFSRPVLDSSTSLAPATDPALGRMSLGRADLNRSMDRMVLNGGLEDDESRFLDTGETHPDALPDLRLQLNLVHRWTYPLGDIASLVPSVDVLPSTTASSPSVALRFCDSSGRAAFSIYLVNEGGHWRVSSYEDCSASRRNPTEPVANADLSVPPLLVPAGTSLGSRSSCESGSSPAGLVLRCRRALRFALPDPDMIQLDAALAQDRFRRPIDGLSSPWDAFVIVLLAQLGLRGAVKNDKENEDPSPKSGRSWARLQSSLGSSNDISLLSLAPPDQVERSAGFQAAATRGSHLPAVLLALHLVAEDAKLSLERFSEVDLLGPLLQCLGSSLGRPDWVDYWARQTGGHGQFLGGNVYQPALDAALLPAPPDIYAQLSAIACGLVLPGRWPALSALDSSDRDDREIPLEHPCRLTSRIMEVYASLSPTSCSVANEARREEKVVYALVAHGFSVEQLLDLPFGVALPLHEAIRACRTLPPKDWPRKAFELVQRPDLVRRHGPPRSRRLSYHTVAADDDADAKSVEAITSVRGLPVPKRLQPISPALGVGASRFGSDRRLDEVERLLSTTSMPSIRLPDCPNQTDQEVALAHKNAVVAVSQRTCSLSVGQGIFTFGSAAANVTMPWPVPPVDLSVRVLPQNAVLSVDPAAVTTEAREWSSFHNGVAAGLRISSKSRGVDSSWVVFNRPSEANPSHAGLLLGLGLSGHLRGMMPWHAFPYLDSRHDFTSIGLLLGLAASYASTEDALLTKILSLHVHALLPHGSRELHASPLTQGAALLGIGILYAGKRNRKMAEIALAEISRPVSASSELSSTYAEAYAFSAAMSFGFIMVGRGRGASNPRDLEMTSRLKTLVHVSPRSSTTATPSTGNQTHASSLDVNLTAPGATVALGLMFLRSGREDIARSLGLPQTRFDLDLIRPDLLLLRTLARSLILWENVVASEAWVCSHLPAFITSSLRKRKRGGSAVDHGIELAHFNVLAGACFAIGLKYAGTARSSVHALLLRYYDFFWKAANQYPSSFEQKIRLATARSCLNLVAISLATVMAGTGELSVLSRLRLAHGQHDRGISYGSHMAMHMALGILFLGGGNYTLGSSDTAVAALVVAFFPRFNHTQAENRSYPQVYRHLWALAVEPRCFVARDVDTGSAVYLPIKIKIREDGVVGSHHLISPTLLPPVDRVVSVRVDSPRYWPVGLDLMESSRDRTLLARNEPIHVKRRAGFLSYAVDPKGNRSVFVQAGLVGSAPDLGGLASSTSSAASDNLDVVESLVPDLARNSFLPAFHRRFCGESNFSAPTLIVRNFSSAAFLDCLVQDQPQLLPLYLHLHLLTYARLSTPFLSILVDNIHLARNIPLHLQDRQRQTSLGSVPPSSTLRVSSLRQVGDHLAALCGTFRNATDFKEVLRRYVKDESLARLSHVDQQRLNLYLAAGRVPPRAILVVLRRLTSDARQESRGLLSSSESEMGDFEKGLRLVLASTSRKVSRSASGPLGWESQSLDEILSLWGGGEREID